MVMKQSRPSPQKVDDPTFAVYQNEALSVEAFRKFRMQQGVLCKKCGGDAHYWLSAKEQFQCKKCKFRTTLRSGTVLENSKLPFSYLFIAVHLMLKTGNKVTPEQLQHFTGHKYYEPLWYLLRKIREEMELSRHPLLLLSFIEVIESHLPLSDPSFSLRFSKN
jgi:hypothetical protein